MIILSLLSIYRLLTKMFIRLVCHSQVDMNKTDQIKEQVVSYTIYAYDLPQVN